MTKTAYAVNDGKLTDDELGVITRRLMEIVRRINEGTLDKELTLRALQMLIEGQAKKMVEPCPLPHRSKPIPFKMIPPGERRKSRAPLRMRLPHSVKRLYFRYKGYFSGHGSVTGKGLHPEDIIALMWEAENIPQSWLSHGSTPVNAILHDANPSEHDRMVVASTLQWLGTNVGREFLSRVVATADLDI